MREYEEEEYYSDDESESQESTGEEDGDTPVIPEGLDLDQPLYKPHGKWAWTLGKNFEDVETVTRLSSGAQAEVVLNSARIGDGERFDYIAKRWSVWSKWRGFFTEIYLYSSSKHLRQLQGDCVPFLIGIHNVLGGFISFAMEPFDKVGWNEATENMPQHLKDKVVEAFQKLHDKGVLHNDVELRHMLINDAQDRIMIIDFQESRSLNPCPDVQLRKCTQEDLDEEMKKIKVLIDYDGTRAAYRRRVNREKRIYHREMRQAIKEGERELDEFRGPYGGLPKWLSKENDGEGGEDDGEGGEDDEPLDLDEAELMEDEVYEGFYKGRRFNVPGEEYRKEKRAKDNEVIEKILAMKRAREEKEAAEKAGQLAAGESVEKVAESEPPIAAGPGPSEGAESGAHISGVEKGASAPAKPAPDGVGDENQPSATVSPKTVGSLPDTQGVPPSKDIISSGSTPVLFGAKGKETPTHDEDDPPKPGPDKKPAAKAGSPKRGVKRPSLSPGPPPKRPKPSPTKEASPALPPPRRSSRIAQIASKRPSSVSATPVGPANNSRLSARPPATRKRASKGIVKGKDSAPTQAQKGRASAAVVPVDPPSSSKRKRSASTRVQTERSAEESSTVNRRSSRNKGKGVDSNVPDGEGIPPSRKKSKTSAKPVKTRRK